MHVLGVGGWENGTEYDAPAHSPWVGGRAPQQRVSSSAPSPSPACSLGCNLSRGSAACWREASPSQAGE